MTIKAAKFSALISVGMFVAAQAVSANQPGETVEGGSPPGVSVRSLDNSWSVGKAASAQTVASRATVTNSITVYGGFELRQTAVVHILVRGNSLATLGVTQNYLDWPRARIYNAQGTDQVFDGNNQAGRNGCTGGSGPIVAAYYRDVRGQAVHDQDFCFSGTFPAGAYTFSVTPSIPGVTTQTLASARTGEMLFEVTLGP